MLVEAREDIRAARSLAEARGDVDVVRKLDQALAALAPERLLTTTQAAEFLGIRSINTLKMLVRLEDLRTEHHGNRMMIPVSELERIQHGSRVKSIRASDRIFGQVEIPSLPDGLTDGELDALEAGRPGRLPWEANEADSI
ncbi:MAG: helix-turn-helix domain-containing protein, partial [Chloroflexota bacterium]